MRPSGHQRSTRYLLHHPEMGVYLGAALGLGFWSKLDSVGQDSAVVFDTVEQAEAHSRSWTSTPKGIEVLPVHVCRGSTYASIEECVAAGSERWTPT